jgi:hypothetical protein
VWSFSLSQPSHAPLPRPRFYWGVGIGGVIFNKITKGGTSQFPGTAYDYFQNNDLAAYNYAFGTPRNLLGPIPFLRCNHGNRTGRNSVPITSVVAGDFTGVLCSNRY